MSEVYEAADRRLVLSVHAMEPLEDLWRDLEKAQSVPIHQTYDWCRAWSDATGLPVAVIVGRLGAETAFLLPLEIVRHGGLRIARYIASPFSNINNGLFRDELFSVSDQESVARQFVAAARAIGIGADCIVLDKVPLRWREAKHPLAALPRSENQNDAFQITLEPSFDALIARHNAKRKRKKFRVSSKRLEAMGGWQHVIATEPGEALAILETFFAQKAERLRARGLPDVFASPAIRTFFRTLARQSGGASDRQPLQMHAIRLCGANDGAICATASVSLKGDHVICQFASIDDTLCPDASPGELLFHLMIEKACMDGAALFDFGIGDQRYKRSWCDVQTPHHDLVVPLTLAGHLYARGRRTVVSAKRFVKHNPTAYRIASRVRAIKTAVTDRGT